MGEEREHVRGSLSIKDILIILHGINKYYGWINLREVEYSYFPGN
jgi:hypothetical protein